MQRAAEQGAGAKALQEALDAERSAHLACRVSALAAARQMHNCSKGHQSLPRRLRASSNQHICKIAALLTAQKRI